MMDSSLVAVTKCDSYNEVKIQHAMEGLFSLLGLGIDNPLNRVIIPGDTVILLSLLEAMALGKAIVATDFGPRREMVQEGVTGLLFGAGNPHDLRQKVEKLIINEEMQGRIGRLAREAYLQKYTPEKNYEILMNIYRHVADQK